MPVYCRGREASVDLLQCERIDIGGLAHQCIGPNMLFSTRDNPKSASELTSSTRTIAHPSAHAKRHFDRLAIFFPYFMTIRLHVCPLKIVHVHNG